MVVALMVVKEVTVDTSRPVKVTVTTATKARVSLLKMEERAMARVKGSPLSKKEKAKVAHRMDKWMGRKKRHKAMVKALEDRALNADRHPTDRTQ